MLLAARVIRPSSSQWSSPVVLVVKKDNKLRFCVDYKKLNALNLKDAYPLPLIDDALQELAGHRYYTNLDLYSGYWQIPVKEKSVNKTAFVTKYGIYEFLVMPFGLTNAPATFQRAMNQLMADFIVKNVVVYLDDICIYLDTFEDHCKHVESVLACLAQHNMKLNVKKCRFFQSEVAYLEHIVDATGIRTGPTKCKIINRVFKSRNC